MRSAVRRMFAILPAVSWSGGEDGEKCPAWGSSCAGGNAVVVG